MKKYVIRHNDSHLSHGSHMINLISHSMEGVKYEKQTATGITDD